MTKNYKQDEPCQKVQLLSQILPVVAEQTEFAIKGGTAINLFYQDFPRYSVDIDLTYLPQEDWDTSLKQIAGALESIGKKIKRNFSGISVRKISGGGNLDSRILVSNSIADVKIEVSPVARNTLFPPSNIRVKDTFKQKFSDVCMFVVNYDEVYANKFSATLDRCLPRDLFDVKIFFESDHMSDLLFRVSLVYLLCSRRPIHELLSPSKKNIEENYIGFESMMRKHVGLDDLYLAKDMLVKSLRERLNSISMKFLEDFHLCKPDFSLIGLPQAENLPAIRWKLLNLEKLRRQSPEKHVLQLERIRQMIEL